MAYCRQATAVHLPVWNKTVCVHDPLPCTHRVLSTLRIYWKSYSIILTHGVYVVQTNCTRELVDKWSGWIHRQLMLSYSLKCCHIVCFVWLALGSHNKGQKSLHKTLQMKKLMQHNPIWRTTGECKQRPTSHQPVTVPPPQAWQPSVSEEMDGLHPWQGTVWCQAVTHQSWNAL